MNLIEKIPGTKYIAQRMDQAAIDFRAVLQDLGGLSEDEAKVAHAVMIDCNMLKRQGIGRIAVKHGSFLDRIVIRRCAGLEEAYTPMLKGLIAKHRKAYLGDKA